MKRCNNCFEEYDGALDTCPHCGYTNGDRAAEPRHLPPGTALRGGAYIVGRVLGYGGFGVTYLGWDATLERRVAVKEYLPSEFSTRMPGVTQVTVFSGDKAEQFESGALRFVEEAGRLAQFRGEEGIVGVYDTFRENGTAYIAMEHLEGETLAQLLEREDTLPVDEAVQMLAPIMKSLQAVHKHGIIHRDIAPDNIMIAGHCGPDPQSPPMTADTQAKLIDFGAARHAAATHSRSLTVVVKAGYSPEEQYRSRGDQGPWTDVYALGATMYRMVTGRRPPDAMERRAWLEGKGKDILEPMSKYAKGVGSAQEAAVHNAMNVRIEDRTPDMETFESELASAKGVRRRQGGIRKTDVLKWPLWLKVTVPVVACAVITLLVLLFVGVFEFPEEWDWGPFKVPDGMVRVPSLVNYDLESAEEKLGGSLVLLVAGKEVSGDIPANLILSHEPTARSIVPVGSEINVVVSTEHIIINDELYNISLTELRLDRQNLTDEDIKELRYMTNLTALSLESNSISDITPLAELTELNELNLWNNKISDITPLSGLTKLEVLNLSRNQVEDISLLPELTDLRVLGLAFNPVSDQSRKSEEVSRQLAELPNLEQLEISYNYDREFWETDLLTGYIRLTRRSPDE